MQTRQEQGTIWPEQLGMHRNRSCSQVRNGVAGRNSSLLNVPNDLPPLAFGAQSAKVGCMTEVSHA